MPLRTQRIHNRQKHSIALHSSILQIAVQCHLEVPGATVERPKFSASRYRLYFCRCAFRVVVVERGICVSNKRSHSDPLQVRRRQHVSAIASPHITNPSLILFGNKI